MTCGTWTTLFYAAATCAVLGTIATGLAWRHRLSNESGSRWLVDPTVLFRPSLFANPRSAARKMALVFVLAGVLLGLAVSVPAIAAVLRGESGFCGGAF